MRSNMDTLLESKVFADDLGKEIFTEWLAMTDSIEPHFVTREKCTALGDNFFQKKEIDPDQQHKGPQPYNLYLPTDMKMGEILYFVDTISKAVGKDDRVSMPRLASLVNTRLWYLHEKNEISDDDIRGREKKYNISQETTSLIKNAKISHSFLRSMYTAQNWSLSDEAMRFIKQSLVHSLDTVFFERGTESLFEWMEVFTQGERESLSDDARNNDANKSKRREFFDTEEKKLSEKIGMVDLMAESKTIQDKSSPERASFVLKAAWKILEEVYNYPNVLTEISSHNIKSLLEKKEMVCLTKSILMHIFLKKLCITHSAMNIPNHSAIQISLYNGDEYIMDAYHSKELIDLKEYIKNKEWAYISLKEFNNANRKDLLYQIADPIDVLQAQVYLNKWYYHSKGWRYEKAMEYYNKSLKILPNSHDVRYNIWLVHLANWEYQKAIECMNKSLDLNPYAYYALYVIGWLYQKGWEYPKAVEYYDRVMKFYNKARGYYNKDTEMKPHLYDLWNNKWAIHIEQWEYTQACQCFLVAAALDTWREDITYTDRARFFAYNQIQSPEEKRALKELKRIDDLPFDDAKKASVKEIIGKKIYSRDPIIR